MGCRGPSFQMDANNVGREVTSGRSAVPCLSRNILGPQFTPTHASQDLEGTVQLAMGWPCTGDLGIGESSPGTATPL